MTIMSCGRVEDQKSSGCHNYFLRINGYDETTCAAREGQGEPGMSHRLDRDQFHGTGTAVLTVLADQ